MNSTMRFSGLIFLVFLGACATRVEQNPFYAALGPAVPGGLAAGASGGTPHDVSTIIRDADHVRVRAVGSRILAAAAEFCGDAEGSSDKARVEIEMPSSAQAGDNRAALSSVPACDYPLMISNSDKINAYTNGRRVRVTRGLVRFARKDAELAFALAHEVAHNLIHRRGSGLAGSRKQMEFQADHLGLYLVARAGYPVNEAAGLLQRLSTANPGRNRLHPDYPTFSARFGELPEIAAEIESKRRANQALVPDVVLPILAALAQQSD